MRLLQADAGTRPIHKGQDLPECWLIAEWPAGATEPTRYWLSTLPANAKKSQLIRACKQRWRVEHDYRELKTGLGLDHYEGRKWVGWHHHVTLVAAHGFLTWLRNRPKTPVPGVTLYGVLRHVQAHLARIIGTCPTCDTVFPDHYFRDD